jgi:predicted acetyltransferase
MELVLPSVQYKISFIEAVKEAKANTEFPRHHGWYHELSIADLEKDFALYVEKKKSQAEGKNLPEGYVPQSVYWLVDNNEYIGSVRIRHNLNAHLKQIGGHIGYNIRPSKRRQGYGRKILELALLKTRDLGVDHVLLTCDATNHASRKIIERNGGVLENRVPNPETGIDKLRFWIAL